MAAAWPHLQGSEDGGMEAYKLLGRLEDVRWKPPLLTFAIERHGPTALGSTRAIVQHWQVDLDKQEAVLVDERRRQVYPMAPRVDVRKLAQDLAQAVVEGRKDDPRLHWKGANRVRIVATEVLPDAFQETQASRRRRLWKALEEILGPHGWRRDTSVGGGVFVRQSCDQN